MAEVELIQVPVVACADVETKRLTVAAAAAKAIDFRIDFLQPIKQRVRTRIESSNDTATGISKTDFDFCWILV